MNISLFVINGFRVAICFNDLCLESGRSNAVIHYDLQSGRSHTLQHTQDQAFVGLSSSPEHLTTIYLGQQRDSEGISHCPPRLHVMNYKLHKNGDTSVTRSYTLELGLPQCCQGLDVGIEHGLQDDCKNSMAVLYARPASRTSAQEYILPITYHPKTEKICVHTLLAHQIARPLCITTVDKDIIYWIRNDDGKRSIWISNPHAETPLYASRNMNLGLPRDPSYGASLFNDTYRILTGNSKFVSMTDATGTRVWSFEDSRQSGNISMPSLSSQEG